MGEPAAAAAAAGKLVAAAAGKPAAAAGEPAATAMIMSWMFNSELPSRFIRPVLLLLYS
jgi:hypothetical protein